MIAGADGGGLTSILDLLLLVMKSITVIPGGEWTTSTIPSYGNVHLCMVFALTYMFDYEDENDRL